MALKQRIEVDLDKLMKVLNEIEFFKSKPELTHGDLRALAQTLSKKFDELD